MTPQLHQHHNGHATEICSNTWNPEESLCMGKAEREDMDGTAWNAYKAPVVLGEAEYTTPTQHDLPKKTMRNLLLILSCLASQLGSVASASLDDVCTVGYCTLGAG